MTTTPREAVARLIDPSSWAVFDGYLAEMKRKYKGQDIGYDPDAFTDKKSLAKADAILALLNPQEGAEGAFASVIDHPSDLAKLPALILLNIEAIPDWSLNTELVTAHAHAQVLHQDLPDALAPSPIPAHAGLVAAARMALQRLKYPHLSPDANVVIEALMSALSATLSEGGETNQSVNHEEQT